MTATYYVLQPAQLAQLKPPFARVEPVEPVQPVEPVEPVQVFGEGGGTPPGLCVWRARARAGLGMAMQRWARPAQAARQPGRSHKRLLGVSGSVWDVPAPFLAVIQPL